MVRRSRLSRNGGRHAKLSRLSVYRGLLTRYSGDGLKVLLVNGQAVRGKLSEDFSLAGHDKVYSYVPKGEVWVEDSLAPFDRKAILVHELWERHLMGFGMKYEDAHRRANRLERCVRDSPAIADEILGQVLKLNR